MRSLSLHAYVLHSYDWSDSSLVLDVFTREQGRLAVVAKGAKRPTSQLRAVLLPMQALQIQLTRPKGAEPVEVHTLRTAEWTASHPMPRGAALLAAYYLNELLMRLLPRAEPFAGLFEPYAHAMAGLSLAPEAPDAWLRAFELTLLRELGFLPDLTEDSLRQTGLQAERLYALSPELGLVPAGDVAGLSGASWLELAFTLSQSLPELARSAAVARERVALKAVLRRLLNYHLGHQALRSRSVLHQTHDLLALARS
ncbi:DNA repair protein RecO (recombination protein O) [Inhella inkyongensis]|uniref:DNA repair protein RecO n=1 Tax=Inhella inkyongensis TaxID=392593 RepID=A0A840S010_9BURK|nr:DNA repair protein RecO [Inhella inkyongensis]MBB5204387.1 DNA repair protein RecO (recombination protein O) [Inhella inkyongensis]